MAYYSIYGSTAPDAMDIALRNLRTSESLAEDPERKRLERLAASEDIIRQGSSMLNSARRAGAKMGAGANLGVATSNALDRLTNAGATAAANVRRSQAEADFLNRIKVADTAAKLGELGVTSDLGYGRLNLSERELLQKPELLRLQGALDLDKIAAQGAQERLLAKFKDELGPGFWERLGSGLLSWGGDIAGKLIGK